MSKFKKGQRVWSFKNGWGVVNDDEHCDEYPFYVEFDDGSGVSYTPSGKEFEGENRTLFFKEIPIPEDALVPPVEEIILNTGDIVQFMNGVLGYVETYSGPEQKVFFYHTKVPQSLDEAFGPTSVQKSFVKKVIGNINA